MNAFEAWNLRLLQTYFLPDGGDREVFLGTTPEELDRIGADLGGDAGLLAAVVEGPPWQLPDSFADKVRRLTEQRINSRRRGPSYVDPRKYDPAYTPDGDVARSAPTYLPYLAVLARNAAVADKSGYYAQLRADLGLPDNWGSNQMSRIVGTWDDLQGWTDSTEGKYGKFVARQLGAHRLIGLPKSQVIMSASDILGIHQLFEQVGVTAGEPLTSKQLARVLDAIGSGEPRLSRGLEQAAGDASYVVELRALLEDIHQGWTGAAESPVRLEGGSETAALKLGIFADGQLPWQLQVRFELPEDAEVEELVASDGWRLSARGDTEVVATLERGRAKEFLSLDAWSIDVAGQTYRLPRRVVWVLRKSMHGHVHEFWEGELSPFGNAYLLADLTCAEVLGEYLDRTSPKYENVPIDGLPEGWRLVWLEQQELSDEQLDLPGPGRKRPRALRFEGGTTVNVDGSRQYLHYDLPRVVVMAPEGVYVKCNGERLEAINKIAEHASLKGVHTSSPDAYFDLPESVESGGDFSLRLFDANGRHLGSDTTIRVKDPDGFPLPQQGASGGIDRFGDFTYSDKALRGGFRSGSPALVMGGAVAAEQLLQMAGSEFDYNQEAGVLERNPAALFLNTLYSRGRLSYGNAASQLGRLMAKEGVETEPWRVLDDLWLRGHVELERLNGATTFVHSVPPAAYELPIQVDGTKAYGILGTLTTAHWRALTGQEVAWVPSIGLAHGGGEDGQRLLLPVVRIRSLLADAELAARLQDAGFETLPEQSIATARWSASLPEVYADAFTRVSFDPPVARPMGVKLFDPSSGYFNRVRGGMERPPAEAGDVRLYQCDDPLVRGKKLHVLANPTGFAIARDVRWAKWVATMLAPLGRANPGRPPLVLREVGRTRELWVPGRLRLPPLMERAFVLSRGIPAVEMRLDAGSEDGLHVELILQKSQHELGICVDKAILGGLAKGKWLRYRHFPTSLGNLLRNKLRPV